MEGCVRSVLKSIEEEYDYQSSFEYFKEEAEDNGYEFHDDGSRYKSHPPHYVTVVG